MGLTANRPAAKGPAVNCLHVFILKISQSRDCVMRSGSSWLIIHPVAQEAYNQALWASTKRIASSIVISNTVVKTLGFANLRYQEDDVGSHFFFLLQSYAVLIYSLSHHCSTLYAHSFSFFLFCCFVFSFVSCCCFPFLSVADLIWSCCLSKHMKGKALGEKVPWACCGPMRFQAWTSRRTAVSQHVESMWHETLLQNHSEAC